jgi:hypothetical protein
VGAVQWALSTLWDERPSRARVAEWPVIDPILPVLVLPQDNAMAKSIARMRPGERSKRRPFRQDPASGPAVRLGSNAVINASSPALLRWSGG